MPIDTVQALVEYTQEQKKAMIAKVTQVVAETTNPLTKHFNYYWRAAKKSFFISWNTSKREVITIAATH